MRVPAKSTPILMAGLALVAFSQATYGQEAGAAAARAHAAAALADKAASQGEVNVIIGLQLPTPYAPEGHLRSRQAVGKQRAAIARARKALLNDLKAWGGKEYNSWESLPYVAMKVGPGAARRLASSPLVATVQEDGLSDPHLDTSTVLIGADLTAASGFRGDDWAVVILDTGIDTDHPFFSGRVVWQACFSAGGGGGTLCPNGMNSQSGPGAADVTQANGTPIAACDDGTGNQICDHGVHVAGIAGGEDFTTGWPVGQPHFDGVAPGSDIIAIQVFSRFTSAGDCAPNAPPCVKTWDSDQISALNYVNNTLYNGGNGQFPQIAAINMSLGGGMNENACDGDARKAPIDNLRANGIATVITSGNNGWTNTIGAPGCISTAVTIGGVDDNDNVAFNINDVVDLLAPGVSIDSSVPDDTFGFKGGTSMAAPHVTGAFAVIRSIVGAGWTVSDIENLLENTGVPVTDMRAPNNPASTTNNIAGHNKPRLQLDAAVAALVPADLRVLKDCKPDRPVATGEVATCTIFVDNLGDGPAIGVELVDVHLSNGTFTIGPVTTSAGTCSTTPNPQVGSGAVTCTLGNMAAGDRITIEVPVSATSAQDIDDIASVSSESSDPNSGNNVAVDHVQVNPTADLRLVKTDAPDPVNAGENLVYTLTVTNLGPATATNVVIEDVLDPGVSVVSVAGPGACATGQPGNPALPTRCAFGSLAVSASAVMTVTVQVLPQTTGVLHNNARVSSDTFDPNNANNIDSEDTTVHASADLQIVKQDSPDPVSAGGVLSYVMTITNLGPSAAQDVTMSDTLPPEVSFVGYTIAGGGTCVALAGVPTVVECNLGALPAGGSRDVTIQVQVASSVPDGTVISNTAEVASATPDPVAGNNADTEDTTVRAVADIWLDKTAVELTGNPSRTVVYTLSIYNRPGCEADDALSCGAGGPSDALDVVVTDTLPLTPKKVKVVFMSPNCVYDPALHTVVCSVAGPLPFGQTATFRIDVQFAGSVGDTTNRATVVSSTADPTSGNNTDIRNLTVKGGSSRPSK